MSTKQQKALASAAKKEAKILAKVEKKQAKEAKKEAKLQAKVDAKLSQWESRVGVSNPSGGSAFAPVHTASAPAAAPGSVEQPQSGTRLGSVVGRSEQSQGGSQRPTPRRDTESAPPRYTAEASPKARHSSLGDDVTHETAPGGRRHTDTEIGVRHGDIRQGPIGGFTRTELPVDKAVVEAVHRAHKAAGTVAVVAIKIPTKRQAYALDWEKRVPGEFIAETVIPLLNPSEPRFYFFGGRNTAAGPVFLYVCPTKSPRSARMIYATGKKHLGETIDALGQATIRVEITDCSDLTTQDLHGILPDASAGPGASAATRKPDLFNPAEEAGSLAGLMAQTIGSTLGRPAKRIIKSPDAAHGC